MWQENSQIPVHHQIIHSLIAQKSNVCDVGMDRLTAERGPRSGLRYHSGSYSSFSPANLLLAPMELGTCDMLNLYRHTS